MCTIHISSFLNYRKPIVLGSIGDKNIIGTPKMQNNYGTS
jgi:hypothetical protein